MYINYGGLIMAEKMEIDQNFIDELYSSALSIVYNELKSHYLLGDTDEFDDFEPEKIDVEKATSYDIFRRACCEYVGYKTNENENLAVRHWLKASSMGDANALLEYSVCLFEQVKYEEGFKCLLKASKAGNTIAIFRIALCYLNGIGIKEDTKKGVELIRLLASKDDANALYFYSTMLQYGNIEGVNQDKEASEKALNKAVKLGSYFAKTDVGLKAFIQAKNVEEKRKALQLVEEGAEDGDIRAMCIMSIIYSRGEEGIEPDMEKAHKYLALSYDAGFPISVRIVEEAKKFIKKATENK